MKRRPEKNSGLYGIWTHEVKIAFIFTSLSAVQIYDFHIFKAVYSPLYGFIWNQHNDQLSVGLLAQLVEHCTGIAEAMGSNPVQAWIFFRPSFHYCLSRIHYCEDPQFKYMTFIYSHLFMLPVHTVFLNCLPCSLLLWCDDYKHKQRWYQQGQGIVVALLCHQKGL